MTGLEIICVAVCLALLAPFIGLALLCCCLLVACCIAFVVGIVLGLAECCALPARGEGPASVRLTKRVGPSEGV